jgi:Mg2+-importing ATPase
MKSDPRARQGKLSWLAAILLGYFVLTTAMKRYYIRRFGWQ